MIWTLTKSVQAQHSGLRGFPLGAASSFLQQPCSKHHEKPFICALCSHHCSFSWIFGLVPISCCNNVTWPCTSAGLLLRLPYFLSTAESWKWWESAISFTSRCHSICFCCNLTLLACVTAEPFHLEPTLTWGQGLPLRDRGRGEGFQLSLRSALFWRSIWSHSWGSPYTVPVAPAPTDPAHSPPPGKQTLWYQQWGKPYWGCSP